MSKPNTNSDAIRISGDKTRADWKELRVRLIKSEPQFDPVEAREAFDLFKVRVETRFLRPIRQILKMKKKLGEGMAAGALECILIEHLEATIQGKIYSEPRNKEEIKAMAKEFGVSEVEAAKLTKPCRYTSSTSLYESFLTSHEPFSQYFKKKKVANVFFRKVRCGLLHEGATKDETLVRNECSADPSRPIEMDGSKNLILYPTAFLRGIEAILDGFGQEISTNRERVVALTRKLDDICQIPKVFYFAYGKNLNKQVLKKRVGQWLWAEPAVLENFSVTFNKGSKDGTKANLLESPHAKVCGVCYELDESSFEELKKFEGGYEKRNVLISFPSKEKKSSATTKENKFIATTFVATETVHPQRPSQAYLDDILAGAKDWSLTEDYIEGLRQSAECSPL